MRNGAGQRVGETRAKSADARWQFRPDITRCRPPSPDKSPELPSPTTCASLNTTTTATAAMDAQFSDDAPKQIRIISLNCWGLKFLAKFRHERLSEIGHQLAAASPPPDIIGLQECWTKQDYESIRDTLREKSGLQYSKFYHSGIFGGGLVIISRWPIEETSMVRYPLNGRPTAFFRGDWFVGKGVACARIRFGKAKKDVAEVFCTHVSFLDATPPVARLGQQTLIDTSSSMPRTNASPTTPTSATAPHRPGKLQSSCVELRSVAIWFSAWVTST